MGLMNLSAGKEWRCRHGGQAADTAGEGEGDRIRRLAPGVHTLYHVEQTARGKLRYHTRELSSLLWDARGPRSGLGSGGTETQKAGV